MATTLDFLKAKVLAYKNKLESQSSKDKSRHVSIQVAQQFNAIVEEIKKESPDAAPHLPNPIQFTGHAARLAQKADVTFLDLEMMLNQVLAVLEVIRERN